MCLNVVATDDLSNEGILSTVQWRRPSSCITVTDYMAFVV